VQKRICSDNVVVQNLARRSFNDVRALCDAHIYQISVDTLMKRSVHYVKDLFVHLVLCRPTLYVSYAPVREINDDDDNDW